MTRCSEPTAAVAKETITTAHPLTSKKMAWRANAGCMERRESVSLRSGQEEAVNACGHLMGLNTDETSQAQRIRTAGRGGHARSEEECHAVCPPQPPQTHPAILVPQPPNGCHFSSPTTNLRGKEGRKGQKEERE